MDIFQTSLYFDDTCATDDSMLLISQLLEPCGENENHPPVVSAPVDSIRGSSDEKIKNRNKRRKKKNKVVEQKENVLRKRKLTEEQSAFLELIFEKDQKLETDRKERVAAELQLEPRQVAVWFQNRRARFKCQKLEDEFANMRSEHDSVLAQKAQLEAKVLMLNENLLNAEKEIRRLSGWEGSIVSMASSTRANSSLSATYQTINSSLFLESPKEDEVRNGLYMSPEEYNGNPYMAWMEGLAI